MPDVEQVGLTLPQRGSGWALLQSSRRRPFKDSIGDQAEVKVWKWKCESKSVKAEHICNRAWDAPPRTPLPMALVTKWPKLRCRQDTEYQTSIKWAAVTWKWLKHPTSEAPAGEHNDKNLMFSFENKCTNYTRSFCVLQYQKRMQMAGIILGRHLLLNPTPRIRNTLSVRFETFR